MALVCLHIFYLHFHSSSNPLRISTNNKIPFFPYLILKDCFSLFLLLAFYFIQSHYGLFSLSHPDNSIPANPLVTPAHIVPEWYFLVQYSMLSGFFFLPFTFYRPSLDYDSKDEQTFPENLLQITFHRSFFRILLHLIVITRQEIPELLG
jgi:quinol-cytochrome oxidoreductase complex cytochrome b subunit